MSSANCNKSVKNTALRKFLFEINYKSAIGHPYVFRAESFLSPDDYEDFKTAAKTINESKSWESEEVKGVLTLFRNEIQFIDKFLETLEESEIAWIILWFSMESSYVEKNNLSDDAGTNESDEELYLHNEKDFSEYTLSIETSYEVTHSYDPGDRDTPPTGETEIDDSELKIVSLNTPDKVTLFENFKYPSGGISKEGLEKVGTESLNERLDLGSDIIKFDASILEKFFKFILSSKENTKVVRDGIRFDEIDVKDVEYIPKEIYEKIKHGAKIRHIL